jgi:hypothetical protein
MVAVRGGRVTTVEPVHMLVILVVGVRRGHGCPSCECRIASSAMWETWSSVNV